jgi:hypothetical protein
MGLSHVNRNAILHAKNMGRTGPSGRVKLAAEPTSGKSNQPQLAGYCSELSWQCLSRVVRTATREWPPGWKHLISNPGRRRYPLVEQSRRGVDHPHPDLVPRASPGGTLPVRACARQPLHELVLNPVFCLQRVCVSCCYNERT